MKIAFLDSGRKGAMTAQNERAGQTPRQVGILMLGGAKRVSFGRMLLEAGKRLGIAVELFSYELDTRVPVGEIARIVAGRRWSDPDIYRHLAETVSRHEIDIMLPFVDPAISIALECRDRLGIAWTPGADASTARTLYDKIAADSLFRSHGLPVPARYSEHEVAFPAIAKPALGSASQGIKILRSADDFKGLNDPAGYLIQQYINPAEEFTVDCYVTGAGEPVAIVPRRRIATLGGEVTRTATVDDPLLIELSRRTIAALGLRGAVTIQFIRDATDGATYLMEINPRLGGGVVCSVHAGADIPEMILRDFLGLPLLPAHWTPGVEIARYLQEVVV